MQRHITDSEYSLFQKDPVTRRLDWIVFSLQELTHYKGLNNDSPIFPAFIVLAGKCGISPSSMSRYMVAKRGCHIKRDTIQRHLKNGELNMCSSTLNAIAAIEVMI